MWSDEEAIQHLPKFLTSIKRDALKAATRMLLALDKGMKNISTGMCWIAGLLCWCVVSCLGCVEVDVLLSVVVVALRCVC